MPYASAYQKNRVAIDTQTLGQDTDIDETVQDVVPTRGAVVRATFNAKTGQRALLTLMYRGKPVPFGALVKQKGYDNVSIVGEKGEVYLSGLKDSDTLNVTWHGNSCQATVPALDITSHRITAKSIICH